MVKKDLMLNQMGALQTAYLKKNYSGMLARGFKSRFDVSPRL